MRYRCIWGPTAYDAKPDDYSDIEGDMEWGETGITFAADYMYADKPPTEAQFRAHIKKTVGVTLPQREQPQWWLWDMEGSQWMPADPPAPGVMAKVDVSFVSVHGTTQNRDRKRDMLLDAARKAGAPE